MRFTAKFTKSTTKDTNCSSVLFVLSFVHFVVKFPIVGEKLRRLIAYAV
jgi:hypothetical protein